MFYKRIYFQWCISLWGNYILAASHLPEFSLSVIAPFVTVQNCIMLYDFSSSWIMTFLFNTQTVIELQSKMPTTVYTGGLNRNSWENTKAYTVIHLWMLNQIHFFNVMDFFSFIKWWSSPCIFSSLIDNFYCFNFMLWKAGKHSCLREF